MAKRRRAPIARHRTRAYRLTRTAALTLSLVVGGVWWAQDDGAAPPSAAGPRDAEVAVAPAGDSRGAASPRPAPPQALPPSPAVSLTVPHLGITAPVVPLGLDTQHHLATPPVNNPKMVGWYRDGPSPGETGTAVAVGHRDTKTGAAVFADLRALRPGRLIEARRADGKVAVYTVDRVKTYDKAHFPDQEVYGPAKRPELRLITCGGRFSHKSGYESNLVVFAHLTQVRTPAGQAPTPVPQSRTPAAKAPTPAPQSRTPVTKAPTPTPQSRTPATKAPTPAPQGSPPATEVRPPVAPAATPAAPAAPGGRRA
ncbi:class F sortase [Streptomyces sp. NPDC048416]|uniref:class F sortase n=1 Tax=Streptomyces sp. NPDC048416 TaxID=3365546 RepID=UPI00370F85A9